MTVGELLLSTLSGIQVLSNLNFHKMKYKSICEDIHKRNRFNILCMQVTDLKLGFCNSASYMN